MESWNSTVPAAISVLVASKAWIGWMLQSLLAATILGFICLKMSVRKKKLPPGPPAWPIVGNLFSLGVQPHRNLAELAWKKYGGLMYMHFGTTPVLVVSNAKMSRELFKVNDLAFASRPASTIFYTFCKYLPNAMGLMVYTPQLRHLRQICKTELFTSARLDASSNLRYKGVVELIKSFWDSTQTLGEVVEIHPPLQRLNVETMYRTQLGRLYRADKQVQEKLEIFKDLFEKVIGTAGRLNIGDLIPMLRRFDLQSYEANLKQLKLIIDEMGSYILKEHRKAKANRSITHSPDQLDFTDILMENSLSDELVMSLIFDMQSGASDNMIASMEWTLIELIRHPHVMKELQKEIDVVVGVHQNVKELDLPKMPYLQAVMKESFRLHPSAAMGVPRYNPQEVTNFAGYTIPANTTVIFNTFAIQRDPAVWSDPNKFMPERFLNSGLNVLGNDDQLIPFGGGRRICIGMSLAIRFYQLTLASMLHAFDWTPPLGKSPADMDITEGNGFVLHLKNPLFATATPRPAVKAYLESSDLLDKA